MKKTFLSFALVAVGLLLSVNALAVDVASASALQDAINAAPAGASSATVIRLTGDVDLTYAGGAICIYNRNIQLNLDGHTLSSPNTADVTVIHLVLGKLDIIGGEGSTITNLNTEGDDWKSAAIMVYGSRTYTGTASDADKKKTHLSIGANVVVSSLHKGVEVYTYGNGKRYDLGFNEQTSSSYVKTNDYTGSHFKALLEADKTTLKTTSTQCGETSCHGCGFGVTIDLYGKISAQEYGLQVSGVVNGGKASETLTRYPVVRNFNPTTGVETFSDNFPYINIHAGAQVVASGAGFDKTTKNNVDYYKFPAGVYMAGFGHLIVEGIVSGNNGIYAKAGTLTISGDAKVTATGDYTEGVNSQSGPLGQGNAITSENGSSYSTVESVYISGSAAISSEQGYAFEETNVAPTGRNENAANIVIAGGTFQGHTDDPNDNESLKTTSDVQAALSTGSTDGMIIAGTFTGDEIQNLVNFGVNSGKVTDPVVVASQDGYVINTLQSGTTKEEVDDGDLSGVDENTYVYVTNVEQTIEIGKTAPEHVKMEYLSMTQEEASTLIIYDGGILEAGAIVLSGANKIIVKAGGKLLITGSTGIVSFDARNLIIEATAEKSGIFVLSPDVQSNKSPLATVQYVSTARKYGSRYTFDMFASPFVAIDDLDNHEVPTAYQHIVNGAWANTNKAGVIAEAEPFQGFLITNNQENASVTYTFKGSLQGNLTGHFALKQGFNYIGNGYMGNMNATQLLNALQASGADVYFGYYTYGPLSGYQSHTLNQGNLGVLPPMSGIILYANEDVEVDLNYEELIWNTNK